MRSVLRAFSLSLLCLTACAGPTAEPTPVLVDGQPNAAVVLPAVVQEVATIAGPLRQRICVAQAEDLFGEKAAQPFEPAILAAMQAAEPRVSGEARDCGLRAWDEVPRADRQATVMIYYRNAARWVLEMASRSVGNDGFDRSWFNDYVRRFKSGNALVFVRVDGAVHFIEVEPTPRGPRIVHSDMHEVVAPPPADPEADDDGDEDAIG